MSVGTRAALDEHLEPRALLAPGIALCRCAPACVQVVVIGMEVGNVLLVPASQAVDHLIITTRSNPCGGTVHEVSPGIAGD